MTKRLLMVMLLILTAYQSVHAMSRAEAFKKLELSEGASDEEITKAFRRLYVKYKNQTEKLQEIGDAKDILLKRTFTAESTSTEGDTPTRSLRKKYNSYLRNEDRTPKALDDIKKLCNGPDLKHSVDPEVINIRTMIPLIEKISHSHVLTLAEKIQVMNDSGAKDFYEEKQGDVIAKIDAEIKKPIGTRDPEYFYLRHEAALDILTPGTSSTILDLYSAAIEECIRRNDYPQAEHIAKKAQSKAQDLEKEMQAMGMVSHDFVTAQKKLNQVISDMEKNNPHAAARRHAEEQERIRREEERRRHEEAERAKHHGAHHEAAPNPSLSRHQQEAIERARAKQKAKISSLFGE